MAQIQTDERAQVTVELLRFDDQGATFLSTIEEAARGDPPVERRYWTAADGTPQGELLIYADRILGFVQPSRGGSTVALRLETENQPEILAGLQSTVATGAEETDAADVAIEFVDVRQTGDSEWRFSVTLRHPDTGWDDYADGWQVATVDGAILGTRVLLHPHENEQPFTRSLNGVAIDPSIQEVQIVAHDLVSGYDPQTVTIPLAEGEETEQYRVEK